MRDTSLAPAGRRIHLGYLASLGAAVGYGAGALVGRKIVLDYAPPMVGASLSLVFGAAMMVALFHRTAFRDLDRVPAQGWVHMALAGLASAVGVACMFFALDVAPVIHVAPLTGVYPLVAILLTHMFLQRLERVTRRSVAGGILVVVGVTLIAAGRG